VDFVCENFEYLGSSKKSLLNKDLVLLKFIILVEALVFLVLKKSLNIGIRKDKLKYLKFKTCVLTLQKHFKSVILGLMEKLQNLYI
jgi:hypothetical protein